MIISGEKIQQHCDYYIGELNDFNFNPVIAKQNNKHIDINNYNIEHIKKLVIQKIFCYTHILHGEFANHSNEKANKNRQNLINILSNISTSFIIIFHNSDGAFCNNDIELLDIPNLNKVYSQNLSVMPTDKLNPLPIGIANSMWKHGNIDIWNKILNKSNFENKNKLVYFNFNIKTNFAKRNKCYNAIKLLGIANLPNAEYANYLDILSSYKFAICPEGHGVDTHRFWECLYLKVIPICTKNYITEYFSKIFPVVLLDNWEELNVEQLENSFNNANWENYNQLDINNLLLDL